MKKPVQLIQIGFRLDTLGTGFQGLMPFFMEKVGIVFILLFFVVVSHFFKDQTQLKISCCKDSMPPIEHLF